MPFGAPSLASIHCAKKTETCFSEIEQARKIKQLTFTPSPHWLFEVDLPMIPAQFSRVILFLSTTAWTCCFSAIFICFSAILLKYMKYEVWSKYEQRLLFRRLVVQHVEEVARKLRTLNFNSKAWMTTRSQFRFNSNCAPISLFFRHVCTSQELRQNKRKEKEGEILCRVTADGFVTTRKQLRFSVYGIDGPVARGWATAWWRMASV